MRVYCVVLLKIILSCSMRIMCMDVADVWPEIIKYSDSESKNILGKTCKLLQLLCSKNRLESYLQSPLNLTNTQKEYALSYCAYKNYLPGVKNLLKHDVTVYYSHYGIVVCPLLISYYHHKNDDMNKLLKQYVKRDYNCYNCTAQRYVLAAYMGDIQELQTYVESENYNPLYESVNPRCDGSTLLCAAIENGHRSVIDLLLTNPKTIEQINSGRKGKSRAIDIALQVGYADIVEKLFAIPSLRMNNKYYCGKKLYHLSRKGNNACVQLLVARRPLCINTLSTERIRNIAAEIDEKSLMVSFVNASSIAIAAFQGHADVVESLLKCEEIDVNIPPYDPESATVSYDLTPLYAATLNGHIKIVKRLLQHSGINTFLYTNTCTALHIACKKGDTEIVKLLVQHSPQLLAERTKDTKESPYQLAYHYGHYDVVNFLMTKLHLIKQFTLCSEETEYH